jgi:hypothetical protein
MRDETLNNYCSVDVHCERASHYVLWYLSPSLGRTDGEIGIRERIVEKAHQ